MFVKSLLPNAKIKLELEDCRNYYEFCECLKVNNLYLNQKELDSILSFYIEENNEQNEYLSFNELDKVCGGGQGWSEVPKQEKRSPKKNNGNQHEKVPDSQELVRAQTPTIEQAYLDEGDIDTDDDLSEKKVDVSLNMNQTTNATSGFSPNAVDFFNFILNGKVYAYDNGTVKLYGDEEEFALKIYIDSDPKEVIYPHFLPPSADLDFEFNPENMPKNNVFLIEDQFYIIKDGQTILIGAEITDEDFDFGNYNNTEKVNGISILNPTNGAEKILCKMFFGV